MRSFVSVSRWFPVCVAVLAALSASVGAFAAFTIPSDQLDLQGIKQVKGYGKKILLPTAYVEVMNWGKISAVTQTSALQTLGGAANSSVRSTLEVAVPSDVTMLRAIAVELYGDLAAKLRASGWEVVTHDQVAGDKGLAGVNQEPVDPKVGAPVRKVNVGKQKMHYTIAAPDGMPVIDPGMTMPLFGLRGFLKDQNATALETTYRFDPVALQAKSRHGIGNNSASTSAQANLVLSHAQASLMTPKAYPGWIKLKKPLAVEGDIGEVKKAADVSPDFANRLSKALSFIGGGTISSQKGLYVCELNDEALKAALLEAGKAFNDHIAAQLKQ